MDVPYSPPTNPYLDLIHVDDHLVVINKQNGILSVPGRTSEKHDSIQSRVQKEYPDALTVHRLDMETSGVIVMARGKENHREISRQFQDRETDKEYHALIFGQPEADQGHISLPLRCDWPNRPRQMVDHELGKSAETYWKILERKEEHCLVELVPVTGRSHQLRVHMQAMGHPILGDPFYAVGASLDAAPTLCLHALRLTLTHPETGKPATYSAPCPF